MKALPFFSPALFAEDRDVVLQIVRQVGTSEAQSFLLGEAVRRFERELCRETGARHGIACGSGSGALALAVDAIGVRPGDEVIVPAYGCQPLAGTIVNRGATPVFADIDPRTLVIDPAAAASLVTERTVAIMPAHVFTVMADMPALQALASHHRLKVVEDAAVAQGAALGSRAAGRWGDAGVFSFSPFKALGAAGEGGIVLTDNDEIARKCRLLRQYGQPSWIFSEPIGYHSRMDEALARFLLHRRAGFAERLRRKAAIAARYTNAFTPIAELGLVTLPPASTADGRFHHVYALLTDRREELREHLRAKGVGTHVYYPVPLPSQPAFARFSQDARFPHATSVGLRNLAIPLRPDLSDGEVAYIIESVREYFR